MPAHRDPPGTLAELRREIARLDRSLVVLMAARLDAAERAIRLRSERTGRLTDPAQERRILERARRWADELDVPPGVVERLFPELVAAGKRRFAAGRVAEAGRLLLERPTPELAEVPLAR